MHATGIVGWLRGDGRWKLLDGFDPAMSYPERLEIRRQALMSDLFITGGQRHQHGRLAPLARQGGQPHRPGGVRAPARWVIVAGRNKIVADRAQAEERIRTIAAPQNVARHPGSRRRARTGVCSDCNCPDRVSIRVWRCCGAGPQGVLVVLIDQNWDFDKYRKDESHKIHSHTDPRGGTRGLRGEIGTVLHDKSTGEPGRSHRHARRSSNGNGRRRARARAGTRTRTRA